MENRRDLKKITRTCRESSETRFLQETGFLAVTVRESKQTERTLHQAIYGLTAPLTGQQLDVSQGNFRGAGVARAESANDLAGGDVVTADFFVSIFKL